MRTTYQVGTTNRKKSPFTPNPIAKAMGFTPPALPVDDLTIQCAAMNQQQRDQLLMLLDMMVSFTGGKP